MENQLAGDYHWIQHNIQRMHLRIRQLDVTIEFLKTKVQSQQLSYEMFNQYFDEMESLQTTKTKIAEKAFILQEIYTEVILRAAGTHSETWAINSL